jgi:hypothetical protein
MIGPLRRDFDEGLVDEHGHRVEVAGVGFQTETLGFKGDGTPTREGVENWRGVAVAALADLGSGFFKHLLVGGVLPLHEALDDAEESLALGVLCLFRREFVWAR